LVRDAVLANDIKKMTELAEQKSALEQPSGFVAFMGDSVVIPVERRRQLLKTALYRRPGNLDLLMTLGDTFADKHQGWENEWLRWFQAAVAAAPTNAAAHNNLGRALKEKGEVDEAITCLQKAIDLDPKLAYAYANMGIARRAKRQFDEAIACYRKAMELAPKDPVIPNNLANVLKDKGQLDEAIDFYKKAIALDPNVPLAHANLGSALADKGKVDEGIECCRTAIRLDPTYADAHVHLGSILSEKKQDYDGAIACFEKALALAPKNAPTHSRMGKALKGKGRVDAAIECYRKRKTEALQGKKLPENLRTPVVSFAELAKDTLDYSKVHKRSYGVDLIRMEKLLAAFRDKPADGITPQDLERHLSQTAEENDWKAATVNRHRALVSLVYRLGIQNGKVKENPARLVKHRQENNARVRWLSPEEEVRLRAFLEATCPQYVPELDLALHTGMRLGEMFSLTWDGVEMGASG
jgi:tetratricopeptide (TPR) repeat protein